jgi:predicted Zn finger-like uncharacterized protein
MILTCPDCATSYFVDDTKVSSAGRMVRCASCGARWRAFRGSGLADAGLEPEAPAAEEAPSPAPDPAADPTLDDIDILPAPDNAPAPTPPPMRRISPTPKRRPIGLYLGVGALVAVAAAAGAAVLFRQQVTNAVPGAAPLFAAIGLPVAVLGLEIEGLKTGAVLEAGRPALTVTGVIRSTRDDAVQAPPIRLSLLDKEGKVVATTVYKPLNAKVPPGARRYFAISLPSPPSSLASLEIGFQAAAEPKTAAVAHAPAAHE